MSFSPASVIQPDNDLTEETLDPQDWEAFRALGRQMVDDMVDYLATVRERPIWQAVPSEVKDRLSTAAPKNPCSAASVYAEFKRDILPYPTGNIHPCFWGWVQGTGTAEAMLAEMLAAAMNTHMAGYDQSGALVESQVIGWFRELLGFPESASGLLVTGGSMANMVGLNVARYAALGDAVREEGNGLAPLAVYASVETHSWLTKTVELMGLGRQSLRKVPVTADYRMDTEALQQMIAADRAAGMTPFCIVGSVGTVNTGAVDDVRRLRAICDQHRLWLHLDGAFGALAALAPAYRHLVADIKLADSLAFDLHKWMYMPYEIGCVLVKDATLHEQAFSMTPSYLTPPGRGIQPEPLKFANLGMDLSRNFKALKVWMSLRIHGTDKFGRMIEKNIRQAHYLAKQVTNHPQLELLAPVALNVVCYRYRPEGMEEGEALNALNQEILLQLQEQAIAVPSGTRLDGHYAIRLAITNHRTQIQDIDRLLEATLRIGNELEQ